MTERKRGWYWVRRDRGGPWLAAEWWSGANAYGWYVGGTEPLIQDDDLAEIGPRIPTPEEAG